MTSKRLKRRNVKNIRGGRNKTEIKVTVNDGINVEATRDIFSAAAAFGGKS